MDFITGIFATIGALFVFGTVTFWVASLVLFGLLTWFTEDDKDFLALIFIIVFIWTVTSVNEISVIADPLVWAKWFGVYLIVGCVWSFLKWVSFLTRAKEKLRDMRETFAKKHDLEGKPSDWDVDHFAAFSKFVYQKHYVSDFLRSGSGYVGDDFVKTPTDLIPTVKNRFDRLVRWILWWPMSAVWTLLNDPLRRVAEFVVRSLKTTYTKLANKIVGGEI